MKLFVLVIVLLLFVYFSYTGVVALQSVKNSSPDASSQTKTYLMVTGGVQVFLAVTILLFSVYTLKKYGDLDYFFRVIHGSLNPQ